MVEDVAMMADAEKEEFTRLGFNPKVTSQYQTDGHSNPIDFRPWFRHHFSTWFLQNHVDFIIYRGNPVDDRLCGQGSPRSTLFDLVTLPNKEIDLVL